MLSILTFAMVATFMTLTMTKRLSAMVALMLIPVLFALLAGALDGFNVSELGKMMMDGVRELAPTGAMLLMESPLKKLAALRWSGNRFIY